MKVLRFVAIAVAMSSYLPGFCFYGNLPENAVEIGEHCWYSILSEEEKTVLFIGIDDTDWDKYLDKHFDIPAYVRIPDHGENEYKVVEIGEDALTCRPTTGFPSYNEDQFDYVGGDYWCMVNSVTIPETVTKIGGEAFSGASGDGFKDFIFPETVSYIGTGCFYWSSGVERIYLPQALKAIPGVFASKCKYLKECDIPSAVESIGARAFYRCYAMERVYIPRAVKQIGADAFTALISIENFEVDPANGNYSAPDGILLDKEGKTLIAWPFQRNGDIVVPEGVETLQGCPLNDAYHLFSSIDLPSTIKSLPAGSFSHDTGLNRLTVRAEVPPICGENEYVSFADPNVFNNAKLYVPAGSEEAYREAPVWKEFRNILAIGSDAVEAVEMDEASAEAEYFTLDGRKTESPAEGEIVIRRQNGKSTAIIR